MHKYYFFIAAVCCSLTLASCGSGPNGKSHGPIVLGDSSSIVTETDSKYLQDYVTDIQPAVSEGAAEKQPAKDTAVTQPPAAPAEKPKQQEPVVAKAAPKGNGLNIEFKEVSVFIPGITTRQGSGRHNGNSAAFGLTGGELNGSQLQISGATVQKITQRYQTSVILKSDLGTFALDALNYSSQWQPVKGSGTNFYITGLDERKLEHTNANANAIRSAVQRAGRSKRLSRRKEQELMNSIRNVRSVTQDPLSVVLRTVIWQIEGKGSNGKSFKKEIRIDFPI
ncbi:hypothetical protein ACTHGU_12480 [Chitinophagaceae bacterium MMS25-I14]